MKKPIKFGVPTIKLGGGSAKKSGVIKVAQSFD